MEDVTPIIDAILRHLQECELGSAYVAVTDGTMSETPVPGVNNMHFFAKTARALFDGGSLIIVPDSGCMYAYRLDEGKVTPLSADEACSYLKSLGVLDDDATADRLRHAPDL